jgi:epoxyqueuosine reductase
MNKSAGISKEWIKNAITAFMDTSPLNSLQDGSGQKAWDKALIGYASGSDPIFQQYKEYVGAFHWTPWEVFNQHCPDKNVSADQLTVISWVLPQREIVRKANRRTRIYPAEKWARIRVYGEEFNMALRRHIVTLLEENGHRAVAPMATPNWTIVKSQQYSYASSWSERHAAHAAGLGTFGLCDGLITPSGKAMRTGSIVADIRLEPTPRLYSDHHAWCLHFTNGTCGKCIDRCPARAITLEGHDKEKCREHLVKSRKYVKKTYAFEGYGCGLCQVGVPCETQNPVRAARQAYERGELPPPPPPLA